DDVAAAGGQLVRVVAVHERAVVEEAALCQQARGVPVGLPEWGAVPDRGDPGDIAERRQALVEQVSLFGWRLPGQRFVKIAMMRNLVTTGSDGTHGSGIPPRGVARDKERTANLAVREHRQQARHANRRAVSLMAHRAHPIGEVRAQREHGRLGVNIEGERYGALRTVRPWDPACASCVSAGHESTIAITSISTMSPSYASAGTGIPVAAGPGSVKNEAMISAAVCHSSTVPPATYHRLILTTSRIDAPNSASTAAMFCIAIRVWAARSNLCRTLPSESIATCPPRKIMLPAALTPWRHGRCTGQSQWPLGHAYCLSTSVPPVRCGNAFASARRPD